MSIYIIGYGSLFDKKSRQRTLSNVNKIQPILLNGYERSWNAAENITPTLSTTYVGVKKNDNAYINAIVFEIDQEFLELLDKREFLYTREKVSYDSIQQLGSTHLKISNKDEIWIYVTKEVKFPALKNPIIQSYVDTCISGCFEIEEIYKIEDFADNFVKTTTGWSHYWVNDRIYPRAPHIYQSYAYKIDQLLYENLKDIYLKITIE